MVGIEIEELKGVRLVFVQDYEPRQSVRLEFSDFIEEVRNDPPDEAKKIFIDIGTIHGRILPLETKLLAKLFYIKRDSVVEARFPFREEKLADLKPLFFAALRGELAGLEKEVACGVRDQEDSPQSADQGV